MGIFSKKELKPVIEIIRGEFESRIWSLGLKIGKLEHQRNEARRKHGVLKRKFREAKAAQTLRHVEQLQQRVAFLEGEVQRTRANAIGQNEALMHSNRELRAAVAAAQAENERLRGISAAIGGRT